MILLIFSVQLGFMDPLVLAVAAASVFVYRSEALMRVGDS